MNTAADRAKALAYFVSMGWTPAQAAGIVANLVAESGLNPAAVGDGGQAYGIAQWHADRQAGFEALLGKPIRGSSLEDQLAWVHAELQGTEKAAGAALQTCKTAAEAGACVSTFYERPADREGEANRRAALAETILQEYGGAAQPAPLAPPTAAPAPQGSPMGAIAAFLPLIMQLIPALTGIKGLQGVVGAVTGQPATSAAPPVFTGPAGGGSMHAADYIALAQTILSTFVNAIPAAQGNPALAVGMAQTDPAVAATATQAVMSHPDVVAQLNAQIPVFDKIASYDAQTNAAQIAGANAAASRSVIDKWDMTPTVVKLSGFTATIVVLGLLGAIIYQACWKDDINTGLVGLAGPIIMAAIKVWQEVFAYRFDSNPAANAAAAANQQIATMNATKDSNH